MKVNRLLRSYIEFLKPMITHTFISPNINAVLVKCEVGQMWESAHPKSLFLPWSQNDVLQMIAKQ